MVKGLPHIHNALHPVSVRTDIMTSVGTILIEIKNKSGKVVVRSINRPSGQTLDIDHALSELILERSSSCKAVIVGDINLPVKIQGKLLNSHPGLDLYTNLFASDLHQHVQELPRKNNILDLIFSTTADLDNKVNDGPVFCFIDYRILPFSINMRE